ncbi:hypothetical protein HHI36_001866, partial [Cryptolaemus montrouzieri]
MQKLFPPNFILSVYKPLLVTTSEMKIFKYDPSFLSMKVGKYVLLKNLSDDTFVGSFGKVIIGLISSYKQTKIAAEWLKGYSNKTILNVTFA